MESAGFALFTAVTDIATRYAASMSKGFMEEFGGIERSLVTLYVVLVGYQVMKGAFAEKTKEWLASVIYLVIFQVTAMESAAYFEWVVVPIQETALDIAAWVANKAQTGHGGSGIAGLFYALDTVMSKVLMAIENLEPQGNPLTNAWIYMTVGVASFILFLIYSMVYVAFFGLLLIGILSMDLLFIVGPVFLFFLCWKETRFIGWAWVRAVVNYALLVVFAGIAIGLTIYMLGVVADRIAGLDASDGVFNRYFAAALLTGAMSLYLLLKTPDYAAALSGGSAGSTTMLTAGLAMAGGALASGAKGAWGSEAAGKAREWVGGKLAGGAAAGWSYALDGAQRVARGYSRRKGVER